MSDDAGLVLVCGIPTESPVALVTDALEALAHPFAVFNQRAFAEADIDIEIVDGQLVGALRLGRRTIALDAIAGVYTRLMDDRQLPEYLALPAGHERQVHCRRLHDALSQWIEVTQARVVNRSTAMASNASKPRQAQLIARAGFDVPDTLVTNDPAEVLAFRARHGRIIYKSASGVRSIVRVLDDADLGRLSRVRWCPTQFQECVEGTDVRVHVVGGEVFATSIETDATDYRYATREGRSATLTAVGLDDHTRARCVSLASALGLAFAGIDLRRRPDGRWVCFEVNPSPGFTFYEHSTGQPIAEAVARYLAGRVEGPSPRPADDSLALTGRTELRSARARISRPSRRTPPRTPAGRT